MAYNYMPQTYTPYYPQPYNNYVPQVQPMQQVQQVQQPQQASNGLIFVQGENAAKAYLVPPNTTVLLMDSESQKFYIKSADASGMPMPLRIFEYAEIKPQTTETHESPKGIDMSNYVTKDEFEHKLAELRGSTNDKPSI